MAGKAWKQSERETADTWGAYRVPLSGGNSGGTRSDSNHPFIFCETKADASLLKVATKMLKAVRDRTGAGWLPRITLYRTDWSKNQLLSVVPLACHHLYVNNPKVHLEYSLIPVRSALLTLFQKTEELAGLEEKIPVVVFRKQSFPGGILICRQGDLPLIADEYKNRYETRKQLNTTRPPGLRRELGA